MRDIGLKEDVLPDVLTDNLYAVFCGSAASGRSAQTRNYYSGPGNRFWEILETTKITPRRLDLMVYRILFQLRDWSNGHGQIFLRFGH